MRLTSHAKLFRAAQTAQLSTRLLATAPRHSQYKFYDLVHESNRRVDHQASPASLRQKAEATKKAEEAKKAEDAEIARLTKQLEKNDAMKRAFEGNYALDGQTAEERIRKVFGGRIKGEDRQSSSRTQVGEPRIVAGVKVPARPVEPDNCCMSGCINCVWEIYNDDIKDWNTRREQAAKSLVAKGGVWPEDFDPPVKFLPRANLPKSIANKSEYDQVKKQDEAWSNVPVQIKVFAEMEKKLKAKKGSRQTAE